MTTDDNKTCALTAIGTTGVLQDRRPVGDARSADADAAAPVGEDHVLVSMNPVEDVAPVGGATDRVVGGREDRWIVWRQDDDGHRFEVARREPRASAETLAATMEARGRKQTYRVAAVDP